MLINPTLLLAAGLKSDYCIHIFGSYIVIAKGMSTTQPRHQKKIRCKLRNYITKLYIYITLRLKKETRRRMGFRRFKLNLRVPSITEITFRKRNMGRTSKFRLFKPH